MSMAEQDSAETNFGVSLMEFKEAQLRADDAFLETLIGLWPDSCPPQDHTEVVWTFARQFMAWRDAVMAKTSNGVGLTNESAEDTVKSLTRQMTCIASLEELCGEWRAQALDIWHAHKSNQQAWAPNSLQAAIHRNTTTRLVRDARMIYILESLMITWRDRIRGHRGRSDLRILSDCRVPIAPQSFEALLEARPSSPDPPSAIPGTMRLPDFAIQMDSIPPSVLQDRRKIIQNEWTEIARRAGATGLEFVNDVDDEEVPPGIGVLFPYVERSYLFDIGIAEPKALLGCDCDSSSPACSDLGQCPCQVVLENGPAYSQGLFTFNNESEIVECNSRCTCPANCANRVAQIPRQIHVQIFKTRKRGWGARVPANLLRGQVVGMYTGLLIRREEADKLSGSRASYCFDIDINEEMDGATPEHAYSVDAYSCGNWTRFLNHSCCPNLQIISVVYETMPEDNTPYLVFVAKQDIAAYVELTFDYNPAHQEEWDSRKYKEKSKSKQDKIKKGKTPCLCGAARCRGWLPVVA
ncbi:hypothetical protein B0H14DRAFT_2871573 [Mycena olivaceomarginata]|nr:hypothetical protein B0H14DRAFT_2871573 [Mycena olivaceomarginata]